MSTQLVIPAGPASRGITETDKAWMAAIVDVKGSVIRKKNKMRKTQQVVLTMSAKNPRIAARLSALTGTAPEQHPSRAADQFLRRGCAEHRTVAHVHVGDYPWQMPEITRWSITGIAAAIVLVNLAPYMSTYADYAGSVAEVFATFAAKGQGSGAVRATVNRLDELGWAVPPVVKRRLRARPDPKPILGNARPEAIGAHETPSTIALQPVAFTTGLFRGLRAQGQPRPRFYDPPGPLQAPALLHLVAVDRLAAAGDRRRGADRARVGEAVRGLEVGGVQVQVGPLGQRDHVIGRGSARVPADVADAEVARYDALSDPAPDRALSPSAVGAVPRHRGGRTGRPIQ